MLQEQRTADGNVSPGKADPNPSSTHSGQNWATATWAAAMTALQLPGGYSGVKGACGRAFPMSLSCSLGLTFRGFCLQNKQGHLSILETRRQPRQVVLRCSAQSHATTFIVRDPKSTCDLRSGIRINFFSLSRMVQPWGSSLETEASMCPEFSKT